jgi:GNAT superfamily N-acetyltransferase
MRSWSALTRRPRRTSACVARCSAAPASVSDEIRVAALTVAPPDFTIGRVELDHWFAHHALEATRVGSARVYVVHREERPLDCFALAAGSWIQHTRVLARAGGMPTHPIPVVLLVRLAVANQAQGRRIGRQLVRSAAELTAKVARLIAVRARRRWP